MTSLTTTEAAHPLRNVRLRSWTGAVLAWAADRKSTGARRGLQIVLGVLWLLDAALQYQPYMFSSSFVTKVLEPAGMGNPALLADPAMTAARFISHDVVVWNAAFATIQLALAAGLLWRRTARAALAGTILWALGIWLLAEGAGGVVSGMANPLTGAPGAAILYALLALLIWPARPHTEAGLAPAYLAGTGLRRAGRSVAAGSLLSLRWARVSWVVLWGSFAYLVVQGPVRSPAAMRDTFTSLTAGEPGWLAAIDRTSATVLGQHALLVSVALAVAFVLVGAGILLQATIRPALILAVVLALFIWMAGEDFGSILTGSATDPNTGLLLVLLAAAFWPQAGKLAAPRRNPPRRNLPGQTVEIPASTA